MINELLKKFGYPQFLIKTYEYWHILLRSTQTSLGSLIMIYREPATHIAEISEQAFWEQKIILNNVEKILTTKFHCDKINYLMLMMVDPIVHFHIIPRYMKPIKFNNREFTNLDWTTTPDIEVSIELDESLKRTLQAELIKEFSSTTVDNPKLLQGKKYKRMYTSGCFDIFHHGHLNILKRSKLICDYLIVGVSTDELIIKEKKRPPLIPFDERISVVESIKYVDEVIPQIDKNKQRIVDLYKIDAISVGSDWKGKYPKVSCDMVYFDYTPNISSTILKNKLNLIK